MRFLPLLLSETTPLRHLRLLVTALGHEIALHFWLLNDAGTSLSLLVLVLLLALDVPLILFELFVFLAAHVVYTVVGVLHHRVQKFAKVCFLLVRQFIKIFFHRLLPKFFETGSGALSAIRLVNFGEAVLARLHINS